MSSTTSEARSTSVSGKPADQEVCTLLVDGQEYAGWKEIKVTRGMERAAASFELAVSERWPIQDKSPAPWLITPGKACVIKFGDTVVLTGFVDSYMPSINATSHEVRVTGRSKTMDFIDSSIDEDGGQFKGMTLEQIVRKLIEPFKLEVVVDPSFKGAAAIPEVQVQQGETCFELAEKLCRLQECLITDDPDGRVVLTRAGAGKCSSTLTQGANLLVASATFDHSQRFSDYIVKAQRPGGRTLDGKGGPWSDVEGPGPGGGDYGEGDGEDGGDGGDGRRPPGYESRALQLWRQRLRLWQGQPPELRAAWEAERSGGKGKKAKAPLTQISGTVKDPDITRYRLKIIVAESQADDGEANKRADWECRRRIGKSLTAKTSVVGWRQTDKRLWTINEMVKCEIPWLSLDRELVISQVEYEAGSNGQIVNLDLTLPDAFLPEKTRQPKHAAAGAGGKAKADPWADVAPVGGAS